MKISLYRRANQPFPGAPIDRVLPDNMELVLSPSHPILEMTSDEAAGGRSNNEVLHVAVTRDNGDVAHLHFSVGINEQGQLFGEVTAMRGNEPPRRSTRVAKWRPPVKSDAS